jgi:hypothetical protein
MTLQNLRLVLAILFFLGGTVAAPTSAQPNNTVPVVSANPSATPASLAAFFASVPATSLPPALFNQGAALDSEELLSLTSSESDSCWGCTKCKGPGPGIYFWSCCVGANCAWLEQNGHDCSVESDPNYTSCDDQWDHDSNEGTAPVCKMGNICMPSGGGGGGGQCSGGWGYCDVTCFNCGY